MANKSELELFEEVNMNILSLIDAEPGCRITARTLEKQYRSMLGTPIPYFGMHSVIDVLRMSPELFEVRPLPNGDFEVFSLQHASNSGDWNQNMLRANNKKNDKSRAESLASHYAGSSQHQQDALMRLTEDSPFCRAVAAEARHAASLDKTLTLDELIHKQIPEICSVDPVDYGVSGYMELINVTSGSQYSLEVLNGEFVILPPK